MIDFILRIIITLILAGLESLGSAAPAQPPTESAPGAPAETDSVPIARDSEPAAAIFTLLRAVDPCGLHRALDEPTWTLTTRVGVAYVAAQRRSATPEEVDGHRVYRDESTDPHARSCTYTRPMGTDYGISLTAEAPLGEPGARPCPVARAYLTAARPLTRLVLRLEKRTEPRFTLASLDPCAATRDILRTLDVPGTAHPEAPYRCRIQPDQPNADPHRDPSMTISFGLGPDPAELAGAGTSQQPVTIADHSGLVTMTEPQRCELTLAHDTDIAIHLNPTRFVQTISIYAASCDQAKTVAAIVLDTITTH